MSKELVAISPSTPVLREYEVGEVGPKDVKVEVQFASPKHGTELTMYRGISPFEGKDYDSSWTAFLPKPEEKVLFPMGLGNMWVGTIVEKGSEVSDLAIGQRVAGYGNLREVQVVAANKVLTMPERMTWQEAVCYDPAHFALGGIRDSQMKMGDRVAVFGLGAIGLLAAQMARKSGASMVVVVDPIERRRQAALANGADLALDPTTQDVGLEIRKATGKLGVDVTIETSGSYPALQAAIRSTAYNGKISVVGWYKECRGGLHFGEEAHFNIPDIIFSRACSQPDREYPRWDFDRIKQTCWQMLAEGWFDCQNIIYPVIPFAEAAEGYKLYVDEQPDKSIKLGVKF